MDIIAVARLHCANREWGGLSSSTSRRFGAPNLLTRKHERG